MSAFKNEKIIIDYRDDDFCCIVYLLSPSSTPPSLTYLSLFSLSGRFQLLWPRWDSVIFNNQIWCAASMWSQRAVMMQTWLSWAPATASSCVRDLMARPGGLKRGQQSSGLLARSARSFIFCFSCSITLLVILTDTLLLPTSSQNENKRNTKMLLILLCLRFTSLMSPLIFWAQHTQNNGSKIFLIFQFVERDEWKRGISSAVLCLNRHVLSRLNCS